MRRAFQILLAQHRVRRVHVLVVEDVDVLAKVEGVRFGMMQVEADETVVHQDVTALEGVTRNECRHHRTRVLVLGDAQQRAEGHQHRHPYVHNNVSVGYDVPH